MLNTADRDEFACPGMPGVICKSPSEVYKLSNGTLPPWMPREDGEGGKPATTAAPMAAAPMPDPARRELKPLTGAPTPVREPARVMRVWIAPWVAKGSENLHWPSLVFAEITPRRWSFGRPEFTAMKFAAPLAPTAAIAPKRGAPSAAPALMGRNAHPAAPQAQQPAQSGAWNDY